MAVCEPILRDCKSYVPLLSDAANITSQGGEDGILSRLLGDLELLGENSGYCVDIGAWDGVKWSNTASLLNPEIKSGANWSGLLVEANDQRCASMREMYARLNKNVACLNQLASHDIIVDVLKDHGVPHNFDFFNVDVDGCDYWLWDAIGRSGVFKPKVVCIEFNPTIPNTVIFVQEPAVAVQQGSSLAALHRLGRRLGYRLMATTTFNAIFVRNDLVSKVNTLVPHHDELDFIHTTTMATYMFQCYDGTLGFSGPKKMMWHSQSLNPQKLQVLPRKARCFPFAPPAADVLRASVAKVEAVERHCRAEEEGKGDGRGGREEERCGGTREEGNEDGAFEQLLASAVVELEKTLHAQHTSALGCQLVDRLAGLVLERQHARRRSDPSMGRVTAMLKQRATAVMPVDPSRASDFLTRSALFTTLAQLLPLPHHHHHQQQQQQHVVDPEGVQEKEVSSLLVQAIKATGGDAAWHQASLLLLLSEPSDAATLAPKMIKRLRFSGGSVLTLHTEDNAVENLE